MSAHQNELKKMSRPLSSKYNRERKDTKLKKNFELSHGTSQAQSPDSFSRLKGIMSSLASSA